MVSEFITLDGVIGAPTFTFDHPFTDAMGEAMGRLDGGIYCYGSGTLVRAMLADGPVDELHLFLYPVAIGDGPRLSPEGGQQTTLTLGGSESFENGVVHLTYTS